MRHADGNCPSGAVLDPFCAFSAEREPALAKDRNKTIQDSFDGDVEAFESRTPLVLMQQRTYAGSGVYLAAGETDHEFTDYMHELADAARNCGFRQPKNIPFRTPDTLGTQ